MLGEIYIASALAIFLAIFGWSERLFGLSNKNVQTVVSFCDKTKLTHQKYLELVDLIKKEKTLRPGEYMKSIIKILRGSNIKKEDKPVINKLKENGELFRRLEKFIKYKKVYFILLFVYLFIGGTILTYFETVYVTPLVSIIDYKKLFEPFFVAQSLLFFIIGIGMIIYSKLNAIETEIHNNLMDVTTKITGSK